MFLKNKQNPWNIPVKKFMFTCLLFKIMLKLKVVSFYLSYYLLLFPFIFSYFFFYFFFLSFYLFLRNNSLSWIIFECFKYKILKVLDQIKPRYSSWLKILFRKMASNKNIGFSKIESSGAVVFKKHLLFWIKNRMFLK